MNCCRDTFEFCTVVAPCTGDTLPIRIPIGFASSPVTVLITNAAGFTESQVFELSEGQIWLDWTIEDTIEGFFSKGGGPYLLEFVKPDSMISVFTAIDGKDYYAAQFRVGPFQSGGPQFLNLFNNDVPPIP